MVFAAIAVYAIAPRTKDGRILLPIDRKVIDDVIVYGDDIIVPAHEYTRVASALKSFGFKVNEKKSFYKGHFRESCGADFFMGYDVSYVKVRQPLSSTTTRAVETVSTVSLRNQLAATGLYPLTVRKLDSFLVRGLGLLPYGSTTSPGLVRVGGPHSEDVPARVGRHDPATQKGMQKAFVLTSQFASDPLDGMDGVHKALRLLHRRGDLPASEPVSYETAGRAVRARLSARWLPA